MPFQFFINVEKKKKMENVFGGVREGCASICGSSTFADLSLERYAVKNMQSAEVQGATLTLRTF